MEARLVVLGSLVAIALLEGCSLGSTASTPAKAAPPAEVTQIEGSERSQVLLTADAAERLGIKTEPARTAADASFTVIPLAALIYDIDGRTWVYTTSQPRTFARQLVTVARIEGDSAILQEGLQPGDLVVTVGGAELLGAENGVEGE